MLEHNRNDGVNVTRGHSNEMNTTIVEDDHVEWTLVQGKGKKRHVWLGTRKDILRPENSQMSVPIETR